MTRRITITEFQPCFAERLPETLALIKSAGLAAHPAVTQITVHGSRGLAQKARPDSDIDLSLMVGFAEPPAIDERLGRLLEEVIAATAANWKSAVEADLAAVFPLSACNLKCFQVSAYDPAICPSGGRDCFGIYKSQKGFVLDQGIQVERMYPCITVWRKKGGKHYLPSSAAG